MAALQILDELKALGTEQNRKLYRRRGIGENVYGVSYADLKKLVKRIKVDHELAQKLWTSGNHDARILALMIADPKKADSDLLERWVRDLEDYVLADALAVYVAKTALAREKMEHWMASDSEWISTMGWNVLANLAMQDKSLPDTFFEKYLTIIEREIQTQKNRVRHAMNGALIAIGTTSAGLKQKAVAVAQKIGKVIVDHGETDCKTPDAVPYIEKVWDRQKSKA